MIALVRDLPPDLPAALFVVLHTPSRSPSRLPAILASRGPLPAAHAAHGQAIVPGRIYVVPPDHHLLVRKGYVELTRGPRENSSRPAVDPLFRAAARTYGPRVVGVVLSGALGDGARGLTAIAACGGVTVVQDPDEALFDGMPCAALSFGHVDHKLSIGQMAALLARLAREPAEEKGWRTMDEIDEAEDRASALAWRDITAQARGERANETTVYTCPECGGTLWQLDQNGVLQFNCHVGHTYGAEALLDEMSEELEAALWRCVRLLVEKATLARQFAQRLRATGQEAHAARVGEQAQLDDRHGQLIRDLLLEGISTPAAETLAVELTLAAARTGHPPASGK